MQWLPRRAAGSCGPAASALLQLAQRMTVKDEVGANLISEWHLSELPLTSCTCFSLHSAEQAPTTSPNWH